MPRKKTTPTQTPEYEFNITGRSRQPSRHLTGLYSLDWALGGLPNHCTAMIYGPTGVGKTTLGAFMAGSFAQKRRIEMADFEFTPAESLYWYAAQGGFSGELHLIEDTRKDDVPESGEEMLEKLCDQLLDPATAVIMLDAVSSVVPQAVIENKLKDANMGLLARLMSNYMKRVMVRLRRPADSLSLLINHQRPVIGTGYGFNIPGGEAVKDYSQIILRVWRGKEFDNGDYVITGKVEKNRFDARRREFSVYVISQSYEYQTSHRATPTATPETRWLSGVSPAMTAVWDCVMTGLAKSESTISMGGKSYGRLSTLSERAVAALHGDDQAAKTFEPFYAALKGA